MEDLSGTTQRLVDEINKHLYSIPDFELLEGADVYDIEKVRNNYNKVLYYNTKLNDLIIKSEHFQSILKTSARRLSDNNALERGTKAQVREATDIVNDISKALYTDKDRIERLLRYYERAFNIYIRP